MRIAQDVTLESLRHADSIDSSMVRDFAAGQESVKSFEEARDAIEPLIEAKGTRYAKVLWGAFRAGHEEAVAIPLATLGKFWGDGARLEIPRASYDVGVRKMLDRAGDEVARAVTSDFFSFLSQRFPELRGAAWSNDFDDFRLVHPEVSRQFDAIRSAIAGGMASDEAAPFDAIIPELERLSFEHRQSMAKEIAGELKEQTSSYVRGVLEAFYVRQLMLAGLESVDPIRDFDAKWMPLTKALGGRDQISRYGLALALKKGARRKDLPQGTNPESGALTNRALVGAFHTDQVLRIKDELARRGLPDTVEGGVAAFLRGDDLKTLPIESRLAAELPLTENLGIRPERAPKEPPPPPYEQVEQVVGDIQRFAWKPIDESATDRRRAGGE